MSAAGRLSRLVPRALLALALGLGAGACGSTRACKSGTLFVAVDFQGDAINADNLLVVVVDDAGSPRQSIFPHGPGTAQGTIQIDFPLGYHEGSSVGIVLTAQLGGAAASSVSTAVLLTPGCTTLRLQLGGGDGGEVDVPGETGGTSGSGGSGGNTGGVGGAGGTGGAGGQGTGGTAGASAGGRDGGGDATPGDGAAGTSGAGGRIDAGGDRGPDGSCSTTEDCFNGIDDDCNGHIDCDDPACVPSLAVCVPAAGAGGFVAGAYVDATMACPAGFSAGETAINATINAGAGGCTGCSCQTSITCTANVSKYANNLTCTLNGATALAGSIRSDYATGAAAPTNTCLVSTFTMANPPSVDVYVTSGPSACTPQGTPAPPTPTWATSRKFCKAATVGAGCAAGFVCVPASSANHCVVAPGAPACPTGYTKDSASWYTGFNDARSCGACACGTQTAGSCAPLRASFYVGTGCNTAVQTSLASGAKTCTFATDCQSVGFGGTPTLPTCPASSALTGSVAPTGQQTLCCF